VQATLQATSVTNGMLVNPATTVNSQTCTLGSTCTIPFQTNSVNNTSQAGLNLLTSTANTVGLTTTPTNSGTNQEKFEITGTYSGSGASIGAGTIPTGSLATVQGNGTKVQLASGTTTLNNCPKYDASGNLIDSGAPCGGGSSVSVNGSGVSSPNFNGTTPA